MMMLMHISQLAEEEAVARLSYLPLVGIAFFHVASALTPLEKSVVDDQAPLLQCVMASTVKTMTKYLHHLLHSGCVSLLVAVVDCSWLLLLSLVV